MNTQARPEMFLDSESIPKRLTISDDASNSTIAWFSIELYSKPLLDASDTRNQDTVRNETVTIVNENFSDWYPNFNELLLVVERVEPISREIEVMSNRTYPGRRPGIDAYADMRNDTDTDTDASHAHAHDGEEHGLLLSFSCTIKYYYQPTPSRTAVFLDIIDLLNRREINDQLKGNMSSQFQHVSNAYEVRAVRAIPYRSDQPSWVPTMASNFPTRMNSKLPSVRPSNSPSLSVSNLPSVTPSNLPSFFVSSTLTPSNDPNGTDQPSVKENLNLSLDEPILEPQNEESSSPLVYETSQYIRGENPTMTPSDYAESLLLVAMKKGSTGIGVKRNGTNVGVTMCVVFSFLILAVLYHRKRRRARKQNLEEEEEDSELPTVDPQHSDDFSSFEIEKDFMTTARRFNDGSDASDARIKQKEEEQDSEGVMIVTQHSDGLPSLEAERVFVISARTLNEGGNDTRSMIEDIARHKKKKRKKKRKRELESPTSTGPTWDWPLRNVYFHL